MTAATAHALDQYDMAVKRLALLELETLTMPDQAAAVDAMLAYLGYRRDFGPTLYGLRQMLQRRAVEEVTS